MGFFIDSLIGLVLVGVLVGVLLVHRRQRLLVDSLIALLLLGVLASVLLYHRNKKLLDQQSQLVQQALAVLHDQIAYHAAMELGESGTTVFPAAASPLWFKTGLPMNILVPGWHPWLDVAPTGDMEDDPPDPIVTHAGQAGLWYNPNRGVFRARVQDQGSESATLTLYNKLNGTELKLLPTADRQARQPRPLILVLLEARAQAQAKAAADEAQQQDESQDQLSPSMGDAPDEDADDHTSLIADPVPSH